MTEGRTRFGGAVQHRFPEGFRSGFVCFAGRPNVGKSSLINALVGAEVMITSAHPQTTRRAVRAILNAPEHQIVIVDTPGVHRPRTALSERLNDAAAQAFAEVDVVGFCVPADEEIGPGDRFILDQVRREAPKAKLIGLVTKIDKRGRERTAEQLLALSVLLGPEHEVVPVSRQSPEQLSALTELLVGLMPEGPPWYPTDQVVDDSDEARVAELVREAALARLRDELPHSVMVVVEETERKKGLWVVYASLYVERPSQKAIVIGAKGSVLREIGAAARSRIEAAFGTRVHLDLRVKVAKDWQRDPKQLDRFGF
ncbi:GTPase Era [Segniliparus rugosus]|uniref:GTPase Era n=1 Tax=Segniliparus rugosus (strain ATCC BAA-974 / DSM 45345 / CCUG 50838 / CIP 108380 / JCM 13579 / CDC 945) TaxID=679197 RepID=E5XTG0_SEGRC|nr:GTPase Era [Segniliparus rugosus]EFV12372.2 GTP-binding protein Era [Segniliparus rugosus ATCC BAA-974]